MGLPSLPSKNSRFVFPKWTNSLRGFSAFLSVGGLIYLTILVGYVFAPGTSAEGYAPEQPVPYSHALHAGQLGLDCRYCHNTVESSARAAIPPAATCMNCHSMVKTQSEKLAPIRRSDETGQPVRWQRVHDLPDFVYFNHSAHITAGVGCVECHGRIDAMEVVHQEKQLTMGWCLKCHRNPETHLRPPELVTQMSWQPGDDAEERGRELMKEHDITPSDNCSTCHR